MKPHNWLAAVVATVAAATAPTLIVVPSVWAAENIVVPDGPFAGERWDPELAPHLIEPLDCLALDHPCNVVSIRKAAQTGFTGIGIAWLGALIDTAPARILAVQPTVDAAKDFNREKLQPTILGTPALARKVADLKSRDGLGSTTLSKSFLGGSLTIAGANSTAGLRSKTVRYVLADEIDEWLADLDGQGDPMKMVDARQLSFRATGDWKKLQISTPTMKGASRIDNAFERGDQRYRHVPCPSCGAFQVLVFEKLQFAKTFPHQAVYICDANGCVIPHSAKRAMSAAGRWIAKEPGPGRAPSFHFDTLLSPFVTWNDIVEAFLEAEDDPPMLKTFWNLWLARSYEVKGKAPAWEDLQRRATAIGSHQAGDVPAWVLFLTMGVDVQGDRLEASVWGWGTGKTCCLIDHYVLTGDTNGLDVWIALTKLWQRTWTTAAGRIYKLSATAVDSGYRPTMTYDWTRSKTWTLSVKGASKRTEWAIGKPGRLSYTPRGKLLKTGSVNNWMIGTWLLKAEFYDYLGQEGPGDDGNFPPGFVHLPTGLEDEIYRQMTAEKLVAVQKRGGAVQYEWQLSSRDRNEVLDCAVYARAAAYHVGLDKMSLAKWEQLSHDVGAPVDAEQLDLLRAMQGIPQPGASAPRGVEKPSAEPMKVGRSHYLEGH